MPDHHDHDHDGLQGFVVDEWELRRRRALNEHAQLVQDLRVLLLKHYLGEVDDTTFLAELGLLGAQATRLYVDGWRWAA